MDLDTGAVVAAELHPADEGDTTTLPKTLAAAQENLASVDAAPTAEDPAECVTDKGYHSRAVLKALDNGPWKTRMSPRRRASRAGAATRRRGRHQQPEQGSKLRAEIVERSFAHNLDRGGRPGFGAARIKRYLLHVVADAPTHRRRHPARGRGGRIWRYFRAAHAHRGHAGRTGGLAKRPDAAAFLIERKSNGLLSGRIGLFGRAIRPARSTTRGSEAEIAWNVAFGCFSLTGGKPNGECRVMLSTSLKSVLHHARYFPLWSALTVFRWRTFDLRSRGLGTTFGTVMRWFPPARSRFYREAKRVFPNMKRSARGKLGQNMGRHMGRTLFEIYHDAEFQTQHHKFRSSGPGLAALKEANAAGKGAIIVSGHFGQWEAVRAVIKLHGMESGGVYRPHKNRHYARRILAGIEAGGKPILATGHVGTRALVRHLRDGGIISILLDEKYPEGVRIPFLGLDALTSLSPAQLALKYDLPMIPAYGIRIDDGNAFRVEFEAPIPHTDSITMTRAFNDSLSARILADPEQWYWMLRRWDGV